jgi:transketolase
LIVEDHVHDCGLGDAVAMAHEGRARLSRLAVGFEPRSGPMQELLEMHGIGRRAIARAASELVGR